MERTERRLPSMAHTINTAMAHDVPLSGVTVKGVPFSGVVKSQDEVAGWKYDTKLRDRSPLIVCFEDGSRIMLEDMAEVWLGTGT